MEGGRCRVTPTPGEAWLETTCRLTSKKIAWNSQLLGRFKLSVSMKSTVFKYVWARNRTPGPNRQERRASFRPSPTSIPVIWGFLKWGYPQIIRVNGIFPYKLINHSFWWYPHFRQPPCDLKSIPKIPPAAHLQISLTWRCRLLGNRRRHRDDH